MQSNLGRLEQVNLRDIWSTEDGDFTPWLAEEDNLRLLGDAIGIDLELEAKEKSVGPFYADILCKDTVDSTWVIIENQLERTDHTHLGQLLTYSAGLQAVTIVWVASRLVDEHRAALDWLNEITDEKFSFFGLEIEVWRIGDSVAAPKFNVVSKPNEWSRTVAQGASALSRTELSDAKKLQLDFWTDFKTYVDNNETLFKSVKPQPQNWLSIGVGKSGFNLSPIASFWDGFNKTYENQELRAEFVISGINAKANYAILEANREEIEKELQRDCVWHSTSEARMCRIYVRRSIELHDRTRWPEYIEWLVTELNAFYSYFNPVVRSLSP